MTDQKKGDKKDSNLLSYYANSYLLEDEEEVDKALVLELIHRADGKFELKVYKTITEKMMDYIEDVLIELLKDHKVEKASYSAELKRFKFDYPYDIQNRLLILINPLMSSIVKGICYPIIINTDPEHKGEDLVVGDYVKTSDKLSGGKLILKEVYKKERS